MYLLDTVTISQTFSRRANPGALAWIARQKPTQLFVSVVTLAEIRRGAVQVRTRDPKFADRIDTWLTTMTTNFGDRILPIGVSVARAWGTLQAIVGHGGEDVMIAATAIDRDLTVVTRNTRDFAPLGVKLENPFS
jgi:predicted nucleic acid-binding protein